MAVPVTVSKIGWGTEPLDIVEWKVKEGEWVEKGRVVLCVTSGKINSDVEAGASGFIHIIFEEGKEAPIGSTVGLLAETKEELAALSSRASKTVATKAPENVTGETPKVETSPIKAAVTLPEAVREGGRIRISPLARKMAEANTINIASIAGTGPSGRIVRVDIEKAIEAKKTVPIPEVSRDKILKSVIPLRGMRKSIAEHMHRSLAVSAQLTVMGEIDVSEAVKLRESLVGQADAIGARITYTDIFVFALAKALKSHPIVNASLLDNEIKLWDSINIGVAVDVEDGLIVPVVKDADRKSLLEIDKAVRGLVDKAREGKLTTEEVTGGTFTITNLGAVGGGYRFETPIINQPESAILGTGGITDRAVVRNGQIVVRPIMTYYFTYDHRVVNGAAAASFMSTVVRLLETPGLLLI